jgi:UDP-GlcNAc:undecaprenyl-phosphate GlcNAc-1-phosphate transferase
VPVLVLALPLFDLALVVVSRLRRRVNPFTTAGTDHLSHRLVRGGMTHREAALFVYLLSCAAGALAMFASMADVPAAWTMLAAVAAFALFGLWRLEVAAGPPTRLEV